MNVFVLTHRPLDDATQILNKSFSNSHQEDILSAFHVELPSVDTKPDRRLIHIGSGNGLVSLGNNPLPEPMVTKIYPAI